MRIVTRLANTLVAMVMLLAPALWNGFPLLQYDTGGYLARWYEGTLEQSRSTVYGLFLNALTWPDFWPAVLVPSARLRYGARRLALGAVLLVAANYVVAGRLAWTPGGIALAFGRMLNDGIVSRYLDEHCPDPRFRLCQHRRELPNDADVFFWGSALFNQLGRFEGLNDEMRTIVLESLREYPALELKMALTAFATQLVLVRTGYGVNNETWHTHGMIENFLPAIYPHMKAARQQRGELEPVLAAINRVHVPVAYAAMLALLGVIALGHMRARYADLGRLALTVMLALLANAAVLGILSGPHDRYGARMVWLAPLVVLLLLWRVRTTLNA